MPLTARIRIYTTPGHAAPDRIHLLLHASDQEGQFGHRRRRQDLVDRQGIVHGRGQTHRHLPDRGGILVHIVSTTIRRF